MNRNPTPPAREISRREFITTTAVAAPPCCGAEPDGPDGHPPKTLRACGRRFARRHVSRAVLKTYAEHCEMVSFCDNNAGRLKLAQDRARSAAQIEVPLYDAMEFDRMIREQKPDVVIVTTKDSTHDHYIVRAMNSAAMS